WLAVPLVALQGQLGVHGITYLQAGEAALAGSVFLLGLRYLVRRQATPPALSISQTLAQGRRLHDACKAKAEVHYQEEIGRIKEEYLSISQTADQELKRSLASAGDLRVKCRMESDQRTVRVTAKNERMYRAWLERLERQHTAGLNSIKQSEEDATRQRAASCEEALGVLTRNYEDSWRALEAEWRRRLEPSYETIRSARELAERMFPPWDAESWRSWIPPRQFGHLARFAELKIDLEKLCQAIPKDKRLGLPGPTTFSLPLCLGYPEPGS